MILASAFALLSPAACKSHAEEKEESVRYIATTPMQIDTALAKEYIYLKLNLFAT